MATIVDTYIEEYDYSAEAEAYIDFSESEKLIAPTLKKQNSVVFVTLTDVIKLLQERCQEISDLLDVNEDEALIILNHYKWRSDLLESDWFENEEKRRKEIGLEPQEIAVVEDTPEILCCMCFDTKPKEEFDSLKCNHIICKDCWTEYIQYNATRPENLFFWKCPLEGCNMVIPNTFNKKYIDAEKSSQYHKKMARAYTDTSKSLRWCPAADCEYGADVSSFRARAVECKCGWIYCFKCGQEDHRPVSCDIANEWLKNGGSEEAILYQKWIAANTKDCPKCKRTIEKNQGCNHMTCRHASCGYEFCWICMEKWDPQNDHYTCKTYAALDENGRKAFDENMAKQRADASLLCQYTKSYKNYEQGLQAIDKVFKMLKTDEEYFGYFGVCKHDMDFLQSACKTLRATKRILKWSFAYSFYLQPSAEKNMCQILQEKLEKHSNILQGLLTGKYQEAKFGKYYAECKERIRTSEFKCQNLTAAFLEKVEEFENIAIEENIKLIQAKRESGGDEEIVEEIFEDIPQNPEEEMSQFFRGFNYHD